MKNLILSLFISFTVVAGFTQDKPYGPIPYKTLEQTIGETYVLTKPIPRINIPYAVKNAEGNPVTINDFGKSLKLTSLDRENSLAHFKDSLGVDYIDDIVKGTVTQLILKSDLDKARKLFLNKTLWLSVTDIYGGKNIDETTGKKIEGLRFEPVKVIDISIGYNTSQPIIFTIKAPSGEIGFQDFSISGTNTELDPEDAFGHYFLTEDPHLKYHFTPAVWKMVKAGYTEIGMPIDAFVLIMGHPDKINNTQTAKGSTQQYVYGTSYYYFAGGKLTAKQN